MSKICIIAAFLVAVTTLSISTPVEAYVQQTDFIGALYRGTDGFYGSNVVAYEAGDSARVTVSVINDYYNWSAPSPFPPVNVSAVKISFDWGEEYTSTEVSWDSPVQILYNQMHVFTIAFVVPPDTVASNQFKHAYNIIVEHVDRLAGATRIVGSWTTSGSNFVVYTSEQADARGMLIELGNIGVYPDSYPYTLLARFPYLPMVSSEARMLWGEAMSECSTGGISYYHGDFAAAKDHFQAALDKANEALTLESEKGGALEEGLTDLLGSMAQASTTQSTAVLILSIGVSIGVIIGGIGILLYGMAKRKTTSP